MHPPFWRVVLIIHHADPVPEPSAELHSSSIGLSQSFLVSTRLKAACSSASGTKTVGRFRNSKVWASSELRTASPRPDPPGRRAAACETPTPRDRDAAAARLTVAWPTRSRRHRRETKVNVNAGRHGRRPRQDDRAPLRRQTPGATAYGGRGRGGRAVKQAPWRNNTTGQRRKKSQT